MLDLTTNIALGFGLLSMIVGFLLFLIAFVYLAFVGFHVLVRTEMTPRVVRRMKMVETRVDEVTLPSYHDLIADIEASEKAAGVLGWQKAGKA